MSEHQGGGNTLLQIRNTGGKFRITTVSKYILSRRRTRTAACTVTTASASDCSLHLDGAERSPRAPVLHDPCIIMYTSIYLCTWDSKSRNRRPAVPLSNWDQSMWWSTWFKNITLYLSAVVCGRKSGHVEMGHCDVWNQNKKKKNNNPALTTRFVHYHSQRGPSNKSPVCIWTERHVWLISISIFWSFT